MARAVLITGGNRGDMASRLAEALQLIGELIGRVVKTSRVCRSEAWGFAADDFYNQVVQVETALEPEALLDAVQEIERRLGRDREAEKMEKEVTGERYASRTMDVDILFIDDLVLQTPRLTVPHPHIACRGFVLEPLAEVLPDLRHPVTGLTVTQMREELQLGMRN